MVIPDHLPCLLSNLYAGQKAKSLHLSRLGTSDWFKTGKGVKAVYCYSPYLTCMQSASC